MPKLLAGIGVPGLVGIGVALVVFYLLPTIIAAVRRRPGTLRIVMINVFLGWTVIGWIYALVRAVAGAGTEDPGDAVTRCTNCARNNPATLERCHFCLALMPQAQPGSRR